METIQLTHSCKGVYQDCGPYYLNVVGKIIENLACSFVNLCNDDKNFRKVTFCPLWSLASEYDNTFWFQRHQTICAVALLTILHFSLFVAARNR